MDNKLQVGDIVRFDPREQYFATAWNTKWGKTFRVVNPINYHTALCMPLEDPGIDPTGKPWEFTCLVKDEFLTAVYKSREKKQNDPI